VVVQVAAAAEIILRGVQQAAQQEQQELAGNPDKVKVVTAAVQAAVVVEILEVLAEMCTTATMVHFLE
jgi:hypothetical protein